MLPRYDTFLQAISMYTSYITSFIRITQFTKFEHFTWKRRKKRIKKITFLYKNTKTKVNTKLHAVDVWSITSPSAQHSQQIFNQNKIPQSSRAIGYIRLHQNYEAKLENLHTNGTWTEILQQQKALSLHIKISTKIIQLNIIIIIRYHLALMIILRNSSQESMSKELPQHTQLTVSLNSIL